MNQNGNGNDNSNNGNGSSGVSWGTKVGYIGTGVLIGLIAYPFVRKAISKVQPQFDEFLDSLTGKAEDFAERASDLLAKAKDNLARAEEKENHAGHDH